MLLKNDLGPSQCLLSKDRFRPPVTSARAAKSRARAPCQSTPPTLATSAPGRGPTARPMSAQPVPPAPAGEMTRNQLSAPTLILSVSACVVVRKCRQLAADALCLLQSQVQNPNFVPTDGRPETREDCLIYKSFPRGRFRTPEKGQM